MPVYIVIGSIPEAGEPGYLMKRDYFSVRQMVPITPIASFFRRAERKNHRAMLMNVLPCACRRDCEMYPNLFRTDGLTVCDPNDQGFGFCSEPGVELSLTSNQGSHSKSAPNAWSPPTPLRSCNPVHCWGQRERVDDPRLANVGVQYDPMDFR
jgi:hypothetical protein